MTNLSYALYLDPDKLENKSLVWDYRNGYVIDADSGEVIGEIMVADRSMSFENDLEDEERFVHYKVLRSYIDLTIHQRHTWGKVWSYLRSRNYDVDPVLLAKIVKQIYKSKRSASPDVKVVSATILSLRMSGYNVDIKQVCQEFELNEEECNQVYEVLREVFKDGMSIPAENRYTKILSLIDQYPDKEVTSLAVRLLKYAKIDGKSSASVASTLIYIAGLLIDKNITMKSVAEFYKVSEASIRNNYKGRLLPITVRLTNANVAEVIYVPKKICRDLEDFKLSSKVICV